MPSKPSAPPEPRRDAGTARFLSRITHDLRQPLLALGLMAGALERRTDDPETRELADDIARIVRSLQATFENIVEWTRLESGLIGVAPATVAVGDIIGSLEQEFAAEAERRDLTLACVPSRVAVACDPVLLRRILRQLLDNAMKFTSSGKVLLGARRMGPNLRVIVADSGIGIAADQLDVIFGAYDQLDAGREVGGLGLGLAIAQHLAGLAGLKIGVRSAPDKGSQFWIDVPRGA